MSSMEPVINTIASILGALAIGYVLFKIMEG